VEWLPENPPARVLALTVFLGVRQRLKLTTRTELRDRRQTPRNRFSQSPQRNIRSLIAAAFANQAQSLCSRSPHRAHTRGVI
jgi:hypothetical protein